MSDEGQARTNVWIDRVREADAQAEDAFTEMVRDWTLGTAEESIAEALYVIAAELRAARIARRPGAGR